MTAQMYELLILDGEETWMSFCPPLPDEHPRIFYDPEELDSGFAHTACWRGYQGTWEIRDGRFYLVGLQGRYQLRDGDPILADWFSDTIRVPKGDMLEYVHAGFASVYEREVHIKIENGVVVKTRSIDNRDHNPSAIE